jgi:hypothetical protein
MMYFKAPGFCIHQDFASSARGAFTRYVEVSEDQYAVRQVEVFDGGNVLRYDRSHWCDDYGMLLGLRFSHKPKWAAFFPDAELIDAKEFGRIWQAAGKSPLRAEQVARSRAARWGTAPNWLKASEGSKWGSAFCVR